MMDVRVRLGKLAEVRFKPPLGVDELSAFMANIRKVVQESVDPLVFCCDWRTIDSFEPMVADTIVWIMRRDNPRIAGNGLLVRTPKLFAQVEGILRDANNASRRVFRDEIALKAWLEPQLNADERKRRDEFLAEL
jgi:hypothetical protein